MTAEKKIEVALRASLVAKAALEFVDSAYVSHAWKLQMGLLVKRVTDLDKAVNEATKGE